MLTAIVDWSLRYRVVVVCLAVLLLGFGLYASYRARLDVFPDFAPPMVVIQTEAPGLSPREVEQLVTARVEAAVNGVPRLDAMRSESIQGLSVVTLVFDGGADVYRARQQVAERLAEVAGDLPAGVKPPRLTPLTSPAGRLLTIGFTSDTLSLQELRDQAEWVVRPRLLAVPGVAQVTVFGGDVRQFQVQIDPEALAARKLTLTDVLEATRQASGVRGAGFVENERQRLNLRVEGQVRSAAELGEAVITTGEAGPVRLRDVAWVREGAAPKFGGAAVEGKPAVLLIVYKQLDADTPETTKRVEAELDRLKPGLERKGVTLHPALFRQANFIEQAVGNVLFSLGLGAALVAVVLFAFLWNLRTAFISLTAIPLSLLAAVLTLWLCNVGLNTLTLGGLAIAVGEVVDDAIIDVENIFRRLRENARLGHPRPVVSVILSASLEVRSAVVYATFVVVLVFVPVFFLSGLQGRLFAPLGYAYVLAVLASLVVALTLTPALSYLLLPHAEGVEEPPLLRRLQGGYERLLRGCALQPGLLLTATALLVAAAAVAVSGFGGEFLPELKEGHFVVHMRGTPGTSLEESLTAGGQVTRSLRQDPAVRSVAQQAGRAELGEDTWGVEYSEFEVDFHRMGGEDAEQAERRLRERLKDVPGYSFEALPFLSERIKETLSGSPAAVVVKVTGDDLEALDAAAEAVARELNGVRGADAVRAEPQTGVPELVIRVRRQDAARFNLRAGQVLDAVHAAYQGADAGQVYDRTRIIDVVVILRPTARQDPTEVANLWLTAPPAEGETEPRRVRLKQVADVFLSDGRFLLAREGGVRRRLVTCNFDPAKAEKDWREKGGARIGSLTEFAAEAERRVQGLPLPEGVTAEFAGESEARAKTQRELLLLSLAAAAGVVLLLWLAFGTLRRLLLVLVNLPFALVGGVAAVYLTGGVLDVGSLIGFVTLFGITTRNGIMMVSHWQHLHESEGMPWGPELVYRGARERLAPVLMTALVTGLGLLPIAVGSGEAGREIEGPMALVILGGLATSTVLNLLVLPVLYLRFGEPAPQS
jgi:CzcA family heavy metal efflux pump